MSGSAAVAGGALWAAGGEVAPGSLTMASMTLSGTPAPLSLIRASLLVSNFRCELRIF